MKTQSQKTKAKKGSKKSSASKGKAAVDVKQKAAQKSQAAQKKSNEKKDAGRGSIGKYVSMSGQFLRESKFELKKVKWPTRKELLASTAVVIVLTLLVAFYLGLVDFGLIKIIKAVVG